MVSGFKHKFSLAERPIILYIDSRQRGGAEEHLLGLTKGLSGRGWLCEVSIPKVDLAAVEENKSLENLIGQLKAPSVTVNLREYFDDGVFPILKPSGLKHLINSLAYFAGRKPALIHFVLPEPDFSRISILAAAILGIPFVLGFRLPLVKVIPPFNQKLYRWLATRRSAWLALSSQNLKVLSQIFCIPKERFKVVYNGINWNEFNMQEDKRAILRRELRSELGLDEKVRLVVSVARVEVRKGFAYLAAAIPRVVKAHPNTVFCWIGESPRIEGNVFSDPFKFQGLLEMLRGVEEVWLQKPCFHLLGRRDDIPKVFAAADIFVLPSMAEGQPRVLLEAMAAGLPCIAARGTGLAEVITHEKDGLLVPPMDSKGLAESINRVLAEKRLAKSLGIAAAKRAKEFDLSIMLDKLESIYKELLR